jgi:uncharacterized protein YdbL (DUF1318 family)
MKGKFKVTAAFLAGFFLLGVFVQAESDELKARFLERKPLLDKMKDQGWIGENNLGFLVFRNDAGKSKENLKLVQAENEDRGTVYAEIAVKVKTSAEEVGKRRAVQIAKLAAAGHWLQDAEGNWYQKQKQ